ncbi:MAG: DUF2262 domain-containing protein [Bacteroidota bacterium]
MSDPPDFVHPTLGAFVYDSVLECHEGYLREDVPLFVRADDGTAPPALDRLAADPDSLVEAAAQHATEALRPIKNESWLDDGEAPLTEAAFRDRLALGSIDVTASGFVVAFDDGDLFWGHAILVEGTPDGTFTEASIAG